MDGSKHQKGRDKGSLPKIHNLHGTILIFVLLIHKQIIPNKDIGMLSCSFVYLCCVTTPCLFPFGASSHPYIPLHFEEMIFQLVSTIFNEQL